MRVSQRTSVALSVIVAAMSAIASPATERPKRFIYNSDANNMLLYVQPPMKPADIHKQVDAMVGTGVTTLFLSPNWGMMMSIGGMTIWSR